MKILDPVIRKPNEKGNLVFTANEMDVVQDILMLLKNKGLESFNEHAHKLSQLNFYHRKHELGLTGFSDFN